MKTEPNSQANGYGFTTANGDSYNYDGLTKREHMAIEFSKAYANSDFVANSGIPYREIAKWGIEMADELIKQLNEK